MGSAQVKDRALAMAANSGRDGEDAARRAALVSLGKKSILFRFGNSPNERSGIIEELGLILRRDRDYPVHLTAVIAGTALHELTFDKCVTCFGRGIVPDHSIQDMVGRQPMKTCATCLGQKRQRFNEDARIQTLARHIAAEADLPFNPEGNDEEYHEFVTFTAKELRSSRRLREVLNTVDFAKGVLLDAERAAVNGAAAMLERGGPE